MVELTECDFCGQFLDDEEELIPIYAGDPPEPRPHTARGSAEIDERVIARTTGANHGMNDVQILGYTAGEIAAILDALKRSDMISIKTERAVEEVRAVSGEVKALAKTSIDSGKIGAYVGVDAPKLSEPEPDLEVCRFCYESISGGDAEDV